MPVFWESRAVMAARDWFFIIEASSPGLKKRFFRPFLTSIRMLNAARITCQKCTKNLLTKMVFRCYTRCMRGLLSPKKVHIDRTMGSGETAAGGAEGERRSSQAKGPVPDDTPKRPDGNARPPKVQPPIAEGISQVTQRGHKAVKSGFVSFFAAQKERSLRRKNV